MAPKLFGLELVDLVPESWERTTHVAIGEVRDDDSIDMLLLLDGGTLRYVATLDAQDPIGIVPAPEPFRFLARFTREVLATNDPIIRRPSTVDTGFLLSIFPARGIRRRVVYILEFEGTDPPPEPSRES